MAIKKETTAGTAVIPDKFMEIISETLSVNKSLAFSNPIYGSRSKKLHVNRNINEAITGEIVMEIEPNSIGYVLSGCFGLPSTSGPSDTTEYTHVFTQPYVTAALPTFTIEIAIGDDDSVRRYVGCKLNSIAMSIQDNVWLATIGVTALCEFVTAELTAATSTPATTLPVSQATGLVVGDVLNIELGDAHEEEKTITAVTSEIELEVGATANNHPIGSIVSLKRRTPQFKQVCTITLTGTGGTANVTAAGGLTKLATFNGTLTQTAADFVTSHAAAYLAVNIVVTSSGADLIFTSSYSGTAFVFPVITNATPNLAGTVVMTQPPLMNKFIWIGSQNVGTTGKLGSAIGSVSLEGFENFTFNLTNDVETRNSALTRYNRNRYPNVIMDKGYEASLTLSRYWTDLDESDKYDYSGQRSAEIEVQGDLAGATATRANLKLQLPDVRLTKQPFSNLGADDILNEDLEFLTAYDTTETYEAKITLINKVPTYA